MPTKCDGDAHHPTDAGAGARCPSRRPIVTPPPAAMMLLLAAALAALLLLTNGPVPSVAAGTPPDQTYNARRTCSRLGGFPAAAGSRGDESGIVGGSCKAVYGGEERRRISRTRSVTHGRRTGMIKAASDDDTYPSSSFGEALMAAAAVRGGGGMGRAGDGKAASTSTALRVSPPPDGQEVAPYRPLPDSTTSPTPDTDDADAVSIATAIAVAIRRLVTPDRCLRAASLVGAYYLARAVFRGMRDLVDELYDEATREEHDQPLVSEDVIADLSSSMMATVMGEGGASSSSGDSASGGKGERGDKNRSYSLGGWGSGSSGAGGRDQSGVGGAAANKAQRQRRSQSLSPRHRHARSLILKLHSAGFPLEAQVREAQENLLRRQQAQGIAPSQTTPPSPPRGMRTAESVLGSLTKSEGQLLTSCLLTPEDLGGNGNGNDESDNPWDQIGGLTDVKESLLDLIYPLLASPPDGAAARRYGGLLSHPPGVLLFGPPGCGKTLLARTLARTAGARFLSVAPSSLLRKFVGETNLNVRALFSLARKLQPCVVFVDEMDGLFRERQSSGGQGHDEHDVSRDLKTEFMQLWDGIASTKGGGGGGGGDSSPPDRVLVVGATNRPFDVDSAFLRRMPRSYFVGLPDYDARVSVLMAALSAGVPVTPDFDVGRIAAETEGYSPSDLGEVLRTAALFPLREARAAAAAASGRQPPGMSRAPLPPLRNLSTEDVLRALGTVSPTPYSPAYRAALVEYASRCGAHRHHHPIDGSSSLSSVFPHDGDDGMMGRSTNHQHHDGGAFFGGGAGAMNDGGPDSSYLNYQGAEDDDETSDMYTEDEDEDELSSDFE